MRNDDAVCVERVVDEAGRQRVAAVLRATYQREKHWVADPETQAPPGDIGRTDLSWFVVSVRGRPAGVVRLLYEPPLAQYAQYGLKLIDQSVRVDDFIRNHRIAEIGRFAVKRRYRRRFLLAAALMRAAVAETIARGYTHYVTDVFEDDPHSPYGFHTRIMGFAPVATHDIGELCCRSRRITLLLDLRVAYKRLRGQGNWIYRYFTSQWDDALHQHMAA
jgi:hypothetical protein